MPTEQLQHRQGKLERMVRTKFGETLTRAELTLIRSAADGVPAYCAPGNAAEDIDPSKADYNWGSDREVRAALIRWLCVDESASRQVDPAGIFVLGAKITGTLELAYVSVPFPLLLLNCSLSGIADFRGAQLRTLSLQGSWAKVIRGERLDVKDSLFLSKGFRSNGGVSLIGAHIGGNLECAGGTFINQNGKALDASDIKVDGDVFFRCDFWAVGEVWLVSAQIGGNLECEDCTFGKLTVNSAKIDGYFWWWGLRDAEFSDLDLRNARIGSLGDDENETKWPKTVQLDGCVYGRISKGTVVPQARLRWLARQRGFAPQSYVQLANVLRETGDDAGARTVLIAMEDHLRAGDITRLPLKWTIAYGQHPLWAGMWEVGFGLLGWVLYRRSYLAGGIVPKDSAARNKFKSTRQIPSSQGRFFPSIYSLENSLPLVKLGQADKWEPDPDYYDSASSLSDPSKRWLPSASRKRPWPRSFRWLETALIFVGLIAPGDLTSPPSKSARIFTSPRFLRWFLWLQILLGWYLATMFLAGVTGMVRPK